MLSIIDEKVDKRCGLERCVSFIVEMPFVRSGVEATLPKDGKWFPADGEPRQVL